MINQFAIVDSANNVISGTVGGDSSECWVRFFAIPTFHRYLWSGIETAEKDGYKMRVVLVSI